MTGHILRKLRCCPWRAGQLAKAIHVLQARTNGPFERMGGHVKIAKYGF